MQGNHLYEYAVIRYVPRVEREEFINVGLAMMCKKGRWLKVRIAIDEGRLSAFGQTHPTDALRHQLGQFALIAEGDRNGGPIAALAVEERFRWLTAVRSTCIQTSRPHPGLTHNLENEFERLFSELISQ